MAGMHSVESLKSAMAVSMTRPAIAVAVDELVTHASVLRAKVDAASEAFRAFACYTAGSTRVTVQVRHARVVDPSLVHEALHDLIMEGV